MKHHSQFRKYSPEWMDELIRVPVYGQYDKLLGYGWKKRRNLVIDQYGRTVEDEARANGEYLEDFGVLDDRFQE